MSQVVRSGTGIEGEGGVVDLTFDESDDELGVQSSSNKDKSLWLFNNSGKSNDGSNASGVDRDNGGKKRILLRQGDSTDVVNTKKSKDKDIPTSLTPGGTQIIKPVNRGSSTTKRKHAKTTYVDSSDSDDHLSEDDHFESSQGKFLSKETRQARMIEEEDARQRLTFKHFAENSTDDENQGYIINSTRPKADGPLMVSDRMGLKLTLPPCLAFIFIYIYVYILLLFFSMH